MAQPTKLPPRERIHNFDTVRDYYPGFGGLA